MSLAKSRRLLFFMVGLLLVLIITAIVMPGKRSSQPLEPLPSPNGYDEFIAAAVMITNLTNIAIPFEGPVSEELRKYVAQTKPSLDRARAAFKLPCRVSIDFSMVGTTNQTALDMARLNRLGSLIRLAREFATEAQVAEMEKQYFSAANSALDGIQFGLEIGRGGLLSDELVSLSAINAGAKPLDTLVEKLNAQQTRAILQRLKDLKSRWEPLEKVFQNEMLYMEKQASQFNLASRTALMISSKNAQAKLEQATAKKRLAEETTLQNLLIQLASHAYELEKGKKPESTKSLVPEYLDSLPKGK